MNVQFENNQNLVSHFVNTMKFAAVVEARLYQTKAFKPLWDIFFATALPIRADIQQRIK